MFRIQKNIATGLFAVGLLISATTCAAATVDVIKLRMGAGNSVTGNNKSDLCQGCHGESGISLDDMVPSLAGQYADYIGKELRNFQKGVRTHQIMSALAMTINDAELTDIATYFATQKKMQGDGTGSNPVGEKLFLKGDPSRKIPPCESCHGVNGKGKAPNISTYPVIGGQHKGYLRAQLDNWRSGERSNSPGNIMNQFAKPLTDAEIDALADYISGL